MHFSIKLSFFLEGFQVRKHIMLIASICLLLSCQVFAEVTKDLTILYTADIKGEVKPKFL